MTAPSDADDTSLRYFARTPRVTWDLGRLESGPTYYVESGHGNLADHRPSFSAIQELLQRGTTDQLPTAEPAALRGPAELFELGRDRIELFPDELELARAALGAAATIADRPRETLRVRVTHGHLRYAAHAILVGHHEGDSLSGAEAVIDRLHDHRLDRQLRSGYYPGARGTSEYLPSDKEVVPALVVGLGAVRDLTASGLTEIIQVAQ